MFNATQDSNQPDEQVHRKILGSPSCNRVSVMLAEHDVPHDQAHAIRTQLHHILLVPGRNTCVDISVDSLTLAVQHLDRPTLMGDVLNLVSDHDSPMAHHLTRCLFSFNATMARYAWVDEDRQRLRKFWCVILLAVWYDAIQEMERYTIRRMNRRYVRRIAADAFYK